MHETGVSAMPEPERPYVNAVGADITHIRNTFAHPEAHWIMPPGPVVDMLILSAEVINQLWPPKD